MIHLRIPQRLFPDEYPSLPRLVQLVLCDDEWARIDAYRMAYEHVYGIRLGEREAEARIRQKATIQQHLQSCPQSTPNPDVQPGFAVIDRQVDKGGANYPLSEGFANLSLDRGGPTQRGPALAASTSRVPLEPPRMERLSTSTSGVSVEVPCRKVSMPDTRDAAVTTKKDSLATLTSSSSEPSVGPPSSPASRIHPRSTNIGDQDREYKHWGRVDDPDSIWNALHVERPKLNERRRFSSYKEYKKARNQPMKDNDQLFKKRVKQSFARGEMEVLSVGDPGGYASDVGEDGDDGDETERGDEGAVTNKVLAPKRQILLVKRKGNLAGQNL